MKTTIINRRAQTRKLGLASPVRNPNKDDRRGPNIFPCPGKLLPTEFCPPKGLDSINFEELQKSYQGDTNGKVPVRRGVGGGDGGNDPLEREGIGKELHSWVPAKPTEFFAELKGKDGGEGKKWSLAVA